MNRLRAFLRDESGQTAIEYGLIASCCAVAIIASLQSMGADIGAMFEGLMAAFEP